MKDKSVEQLIAAETARQERGLELIPSENYVSRDVLTALGSTLTNKYSEGYPGRRYYGGQEVTDKIETLAIERAKALFGADHANVQSHSGASANEAVYHAWAQPGDTILAMDLSHGGHLTHGSPVTVLAHTFNFIRYGISDLETGAIDFEEVRRLALEHKPKILLVGYSSYPRTIDYAKFAAIGNEVGALLVADMAHIAGLIAAGELRNPFDDGFHVITSTTHKTLRGPRGGLILSRGIVGNPLRAPEHTIENIPTLIDRTVFPGLQGGPHMNTIAAKAVAFGEAATPEFKTYAHQILSNAQTLATELINHNVKLITNGTDNHLMVIDCMASFGIDGADVETILDSIGLNANKNVIPDDPLPPFKPSGLRIGTPAITTRGLVEADMTEIAEIIVTAVASKDDASKLEALAARVQSLALAHPLPY